MQNFDAVGLIRVPLTAVQSPSRNRLQPANVVRRTVGAVGQMGLARHLDQASAYSPIIKARIRSRTSRARAKGVESWGSRKASRGALARLSKDYYYGSGSRGGAGAQRASAQPFYSGLLLVYYASPEWPICRRLAKKAVAEVHWRRS